jgi:hypothetical protein
LSLKLLKYLQLSQEDDIEEEESNKKKDNRPPEIVNTSKDEKEIGDKTEKVEKKKRKAARKTSPLSSTILDVVVSSSAVLQQRQPAQRARDTRAATGFVRRESKAAEAIIAQESSPELEYKPGDGEKYRERMNTGVRLLNLTSKREKTTYGGDQLIKFSTSRQGGDLD